MGVSMQHSLVRLIEQELEEEYARALAYALTYRSDWSRAEWAYARLVAFRQARAWGELGALERRAA